MVLLLILCCFLGPLWWQTIYAPHHQVKVLIVVKHGTHNGVVIHKFVTCYYTIGIIGSVEPVQNFPADLVLGPLTVKELWMILGIFCTHN